MLGVVGGFGGMRFGGCSRRRRAGVLAGLRSTLCSEDGFWDVNVGELYESGGRRGG